MNEVGISEESPKAKIEGEVEEGAIIRGPVYIAKGAKVESTAMVIGPTWIGSDTEIRHGSYIRGYVYAGRSCVLGHASEFKGSVLLYEAKARHFAYVGDSILGRGVNLGAGTKIANLKLKGDSVAFTHPSTNEKMDSGLRKFGALMGDGSQTGCNAVLSPGSILMPESSVMSCSHFRGTLGVGKLFVQK